MLAFGLVFVFIAVVSDGMWGVVAGSAREWLVRSPTDMARRGGPNGLVT